MNKFFAAGFLLFAVLFAARPVSAVPPLLDGGTSVAGSSRQTSVLVTSQQLTRVVALLQRLLAILRQLNLVVSPVSGAPSRPLAAPTPASVPPPKPVPPPRPPLANEPDDQSEPEPPPAVTPSLSDTVKLKNILADCAANPGQVCRPPAGTYVVRPGEIYLPSNLTLDLQSVTIQAEASNLYGTPHLDTGERYFLFACDACHDLTIRNGLLRGERRSIAREQWSEFRSLIEILGGRDVTIDGTVFENTEGDGVLLLPKRFSSREPSEDIEIRNITTSQCGRQGVSVISGRDIIITDSVFKNTNGRSPQSAIDVEPSSPLDWATVLIERVHCENNKGACVLANLSVLRASSPPVDIIAREITVDRGTFGLMVAYDEVTPAYGSVTGNILFQDVEIDGVVTGFRVGSYDPLAWDVRSQIKVIVDRVSINQPIHSVFEFNFRGDAVAEPIRILPSTTWNFDGEAIVYEGGRAGVLIGEEALGALRLEQILARLWAALVRALGQ